MSDFGAGDGIPFVMGSIRGHRGWRFNGRYLTSPAQGTFWMAASMEAACSMTRDGRERNQQAYYERQNRLSAAAAMVLPAACTYTDFEYDFATKTITLKWATEHWYPFDRENRPEIPEESDDLKYETVIYPIPHYIYGYGSEPVMEKYIQIRGTYTICDEKFIDLYELTISGEEEKPSHFPECACGFYAYFDHKTNNIYTNSNSVMGIVEGYGETVIGTEGFRSQKMKIIALACSSRVEKILKKENSFNDVEFFKSVSKMNKAYPVTKPEEAVSILG